MAVDEDGLFGRYVSVFERRRRLIVASLLLVTALLGTGLVYADGDLEIVQFEVESDERDAHERVHERFEGEEGTYTQVVLTTNSGDPATGTGGTTSKETILETMALQEAIRANETVNATLADDQPTVGVGNAVAIRADPRIAMFGVAPIETKTSVLEDRTEEQIQNGVISSYEDEGLSPEGQPPVSSLLPREYEPGDDAHAQLVIVVHDEDADEEALLEAQQTIEKLASEHVTRADTFVLAEELAFDRGAQATSQSFAVIGPLVLLVVVGILAIAYRDPIDVVLGVFGIAVVLVWTGGALGWLGIPFNQLLVAVPCLLVGLGIDYGLHVVMRYREALEESSLGSISAGVIASVWTSRKSAMSVGLAGVLAAIGATTLTTVVGFLSSYASPIGILRQFGLVAAIGILSAFVVFGALIPALRLEAEYWLETDRWSENDGREEGESRNRPAPSIGSIAAVARPLGIGVTLAKRAPIAVVAVALLLAIGGAMGATGIDTSTERTDFLPEERAAWMTVLPESVQPADHGVRAQAIFVEETFPRPFEPRVSILIEGDVTDPETLDVLAAAGAAANDSHVTVEPADSGPTVDGPLHALSQAAEENETVAAAFVEGGSDEGDGSSPTLEPVDDDLVAAYDALYEADPDRGASTIGRNAEGEYDSLLLRIAVDENVDDATITAEMREVAAVVSAHPNLEATATGEPVLSAIQQRAVLETVLGTFLLALAVIAASLTALYRLRHRSWALGPITVVPVLFAIAWLLGTMYILSIPYNAETALITAIAIGLGVDYTIHVTERFLQERRGAGRFEALETAVVETGGTVFASAVTTAAGFGILLLTVVPSLQRFGFITALVVLFAFVASVVVLPSLLVLWDRVVGDD